jgi:hypothetical protein
MACLLDNIKQYGPGPAEKRPKCQFINKCPCATGRCNIQTPNENCIQQLISVANGNISENISKDAQIEINAKTIVDGLWDFVNGSRAERSNYCKYSINCPHTSVECCGKNWSDNCDYFKLIEKEENTKENERS